MGWALPGRTNVVITRQSSFLAEGCTVVHSLEEALALFPESEECFVIGGGEIYAQALPRAQRFYLTEVDADYEGDTRFPTGTGRNGSHGAGTPSARREVSIPFTFLDLRTEACPVIRTSILSPLRRQPAPGSIRPKNSPQPGSASGFPKSSPSINALRASCGPHRTRRPALLSTRRLPPCSG
ncbi:MAG: dihydrofolate reductase [Alistipes indistinctus]